jgi:hypothetical protein
MNDPIRDALEAQYRLAAAPETLTEADVDLLGSIRLSLGVRAAVCYELARAAKFVKPAKPSRRRAKR